MMHDAIHKFSPKDIVTNLLHGKGRVLAVLPLQSLVVVQFPNGIQHVHYTSLEHDSAGDIQKAKDLLQKHGCAFQIYGVTELHEELDRYQKNSIFNTERYRSQITEKIMAGSSWSELSDHGSEISTYVLMLIINETRSAYPDWFPVK